jgi:hypothetical protein
MKSFRNIVLLLCTGLVATPLPGDASEGTRSVGDLGWMAGSWYGEGLGGRVEEHWAAPDGGTLMGMFRLVGADDETKVTEFMLIEQEETGVKFRFRHYGSGHRPWESDAPLEFDLVETGERRAVFHSSVQTQPRRLTYQLDGEGKLSITVQNEKDGTLEPGFTLRLSRENEP